MPVIGFLGGTSPDTARGCLRAFRQGLKETGYIEGENVTIEFRWAEGQYDRLPELAADLVRRKVAVIVCDRGISTALAAKAATSTIPIVFSAGDRPSEARSCRQPQPGRVATSPASIFLAVSLSRRGWDCCTSWSQATRVGVLVNPTNVTNAEVTSRDLEPLHVPSDCGLMSSMPVPTGDRRRLRNLSRNERPDALFVGARCIFRELGAGNLLHLASRHAHPRDVYRSRDYVDAGGLMSYGSNFTDAYRQIGIYTGRILKGAKPADLPVVQSTQIRACH